MSRPIRFSKPIPPEVGPDGLDLYPYTVLVGNRDRGAQYAHWFDAVLARDLSRAIGPNTSHLTTIRGYHPTHDMQPWASGLLACTVCANVQDTDGGIMPCELDIGTLTVTEAAKEARLAVESGML